MAPPHPLTSRELDVLNPNGEPACGRARWTTIVSFFLLNYALHCISVNTYPGEPLRRLGVTVFVVLFAPVNGLHRAVDAIVRRARLLEASEVQRALRAGALCMVVRNDDWEPRPGDRVRGVRAPDGAEVEGQNDPNDNSGQTQEKENTNLVPPRSSTSVETHAVDYIVRPAPWQFDSKNSGYVKVDQDQKVHGTYFLPKGYQFGLVPVDAKLLEPPTNENVVSVGISSTYNAAKAVLTIAHIAFSCITLAAAHTEKRLKRYGYGDISLTVIPYLLMSAINLVGQLLSSDYPYMYMVHSAEMDEATQRGGHFAGTVASLEPASGADTDTWTVYEPNGQSSRLGLHKLSLKTKQSETKPCQPEESHSTNIVLANHRRQHEVHGDDDLGIPPLPLHEFAIIPTCSPIAWTTTTDKQPSWQDWNLLSSHPTSFPPSYPLLQILVWPFVHGVLTIILVAALTKFAQGYDQLSRGVGAIFLAWVGCGWLFAGVALELPAKRSGAEEVGGCMRAFMVFCVGMGVWLLCMFGMAVWALVALALVMGEGDC